MIIHQMLISVNLFNEIRLFLGKINERIIKKIQSS